MESRVAVALPEMIGPALGILGGHMDSPAARVILLAIGLQESGFIFSQQIGGPARGYWMFEPNGVHAVLAHEASGLAAMDLCRIRRVYAGVATVHSMLDEDPVLAAGFARLLLWTDAQPLPEVNDADGSWAYYVRNWRPGRPRPDAWVQNHARARGMVPPIIAAPDTGGVA